ncbi:MAG: hypothetical protein KJ645_05630, partial [Planctomycetes bacterium]|nr:hypothetical protein [Planctomycetota bacterium]
MKTLTWIMALIVLLGLWLFLDAAIKRIQEEATQPLRGAFWEARDRNDNILSPEATAGLPLKEGRTLSLKEEGKSFQYRSLVVVWSRESLSSCLQVHFRKGENGVHQFKLAPQDQGGVQLTRFGADGEIEEVVQGDGRIDGNVCPSKANLLLTFQPQRFIASMNGEKLLDTPLSVPEVGGFYLTAPQGTCTIHRLEVSGLISKQNRRASLFTKEVDFSSFQQAAPEGRIFSILLET